MGLRKMFIGALVVAFLLGAAVGVGVAAEKSWQVLEGVQATPMKAKELEAVQGKQISPGLVFLFENGTGVDLGNGAFALVWMSDPGDSLTLSGMVDNGSTSFMFGPFQFGGAPQ